MRRKAKRVVGLLLLVLYFPTRFMSLSMDNVGGVPHSQIPIHCKERKKNLKFILPGSVKVAALDREEIA